MDPEHFAAMMDLLCLTLTVAVHGGVKAPGSDPRLQQPIKMMAKDHPEAYLDVFEAMAISAQWPQGQWASYLLPQLMGKAQAAARTLSPSGMMDYPTLKVTILSRVGATPRGFRRKLREESFSEEEHLRTIAHRLRDYAMGWLNPDVTTKARLVVVIVVMRFLECLTPGSSLWVQLQAPSTLIQLVERYLAAEPMPAKPPGKASTPASSPVLAQGREKGLGRRGTQKLHGKKPVHGSVGHAGRWATSLRIAPLWDATSSMAPGTVGQLPPASVDGEGTGGSKNSVPGRDDGLSHSKGNHEFDFGVDILEELAPQMNFPWFLSNVYDKFTSQPLGRGAVSSILEWNSVKIGLMGLVEEEWLDTLGTVDKSNIDYVDYVVTANQLSKELRENGAELVIAMTHMKWCNDMRLASETKAVDLILGGHDHDYRVVVVNGTLIVKSGSDFRYLTKIDVVRNHDMTYKYGTQKVIIEKTFEEDPSVKKIVTEFTANLQYLLEEVLIQTEKDLDGCFSTVRKSESNLGNLIANAMLEATHADVALLNSDFPKLLGYNLDLIPEQNQGTEFLQIQ
ncbi:Protein 5NUC [Acipenser ruthenus]|uniref:Protein 5NUC n=1 Tax=Acipenser ruthenus TaxID=7906 RepID=A0A444U2R3_ACIRT|nr:Protein 5NUC [Acipenser ruthenus]